MVCEASARTPVSIGLYRTTTSMGSPERRFIVPASGVTVYADELVGVKAHWKGANVL